MKNRMPIAVVVILSLFGFGLTIGAAYIHAKASGASFAWELALLGIGASVAASGIVIFVQRFFLGDPLDQIEKKFDDSVNRIDDRFRDSFDRVEKAFGNSLNNIEDMLPNALKSKFPSGIANLFLNVDHTPRFETLFKNAKVVRFFGPEGSSILHYIAQEAFKRDKKKPIRLEMFIAKIPSEVGDNVVRPDFQGRSREWYEALSRVKELEVQGKLDLAIYELDIEPTVSAMEVDECYYQVTMLFPIVVNKKRPTMSMHPSVAREDYFHPLWTYLREKAKTK